MKCCCENCGWSEIIGSPIICHYSEKRTWRDEWCEAWKDKDEPKTNADKIRQMSDEELARFLNSVETDGRLYGPRGYLLYWLDWLKQEVESDG